MVFFYHENAHWVIHLLMCHSALENSKTKFPHKNCGSKYQLINDLEM